MASTQARLGQQALALLDVALRVPCIFIIDAIFNSYYDQGSGWVGATGRVLVRVIGVLIFTVVLLLSQKALFKFYTLFLAVLLGLAAVLINYYATSHIDFYSAYYKAALGFRLLPRNGATLWLGMAAVQMTFGIGYVFLLNLQSVFAALVVLDIMIPLWGMMIELPADVRHMVAVVSGLALALNTAVCLAMRLKWFYYSCRYVYLLVRHMYRIYGLQLLLEDTWKRIRFPDVLRVFWLTRVTAQALILVYVVQAVRRESGDAAGGAADGSSDAQGYLLSWDVFWDLTSNLIISGCDSTLTVLGMSAVISSMAHYLGLSILAFIGSTEEEDKRLGFVAPVLFFILALQTGLSSLDPEERLVRLSRNMCLLLTAILHFIHGMADPVLLSLSASHVSSFRRHFPVLLVSVALFVLPVVLSFALWHHYALNTWLFAVTAFCVELCLKVRGDQLRNIEDVCAICYQEFASSARLTPCHHYFHALCLRKWLYIQDTCPMCHQRVYVEDEGRDRAAFSNNNGGYAAPQDGAAADPPAQGDIQHGQPVAELLPNGAAGGTHAAGGPPGLDELVEDNDSIEYDEDEWGTQNGSTPIEEEYINDDTDSTED
ncbi:hypothetical protein CRENBAI_015040 [Crenichthys baileyi]|uniref:RING-type domain-containing protein n=1 Tax=Crenichthys baileyi TaxID=28760 RepID=A0AAV9SRZ2_9TELE